MLIYGKLLRHTNKDPLIFPIPDSVHEVAIFFPVEQLPTTIESR